MGLLNLANMETLDDRKFRDRSRQLSEFLRGDFRSVASELSSAFPNTKGLQERYIPLVTRFADELSGLYSRPVIRRFGGPGTDPEVFRKLSDTYEASDIDRALHNAHRELLVQNTVLLAVFPAGVGRVRVEAFAPWQVDVETAVPMFADDLQLARRVSLRVPVDTTESSVVFGSLVMTPDEIYLDDGAAPIPIYGGDTRNPFGRIPLIPLRLQTPLPGRFWAPVNEPLLSMQVALCVSESDTELLVHQQAWGQRVLEGAQLGQLVEELQIGPEKVVALYSTDPTAPSPRLSIVQGNPPLSQITTWTESRLRLLCSMFDLNADAFLRVNTSVTAAARKASAADREEVRSRVEPIFTAAESALARLIAEVSNLTEPVQIPADIDVNVRWSTFDPPPDDQAAAQALQMQVQLGTVSPVDVVSRRDGISRQAALDRMKNNLSESRSLGLVSGTDEPGEQIAADPLNGAQVTAALTIVQAVAAKLLPRSSGVQMLAGFFNMPPAQAEAVMGDTGKGFFATAEG